MHTPDYWDFLATLPQLKSRDLYKIGDQGDSIYVNNETFRAAKLAAGSLLAVTDEVLSDRVGEGYSWTNHHRTIHYNLTVTFKLAFIETNQHLYEDI